MFSFNQIEEARKQLAKEYTYIDSLTKGYRMHIDNLLPYSEALVRIRELNKVIHS